jgi:hypothetical protein
MTPPLFPMDPLKNLSIEGKGEMYSTFTRKHRANLTGIDTRRRLG